MSRGRTANTEKSIRWRIEVKERIAAQVELLLLDPLTGDIAYGARSALVNQLLREWLDKQRRANPVIVEETEEDRREARGDREPEMRFQADLDKKDFG
ncbi:hypothetical protein [Methylocaldum sp.]|uniref:hypothetical protein n=1 Tax=Methylocaldum sp. TaxID=1969727 RepID=UPI002D39E4CD|nr:hypothetical protein [Methylocaldum sp.]HYE38131.1 hypothetical protein [Methylocaldum sp.]